MIGIWGASLSKKCVYCGAGMPEEAAICLHCFHKVTPHTAVSTKRLRKYAHLRRTGIALLFSCCLFLSVLSCVCVYFYPSVTAMHTGAASGAENTAAVQNEQTGKVGQFFQRLLEPVGDVDATRASNTVDSDAFDTSDGFSASDTSAQSGPYSLAAAHHLQLLRELRLPVLWRRARPRLKHRCLRSRNMIVLNTQVTAVVIHVSRLPNTPAMLPTLWCQHK